MRQTGLLGGIILAAASGCTVPLPDHVSGTVTRADGTPASNVVIIVQSDSTSPRTATLADARGRFEMLATTRGEVLVSVVDGGTVLADRRYADITASGRLHYRLPPPDEGEPAMLHASSWWLGSLPESEAKRKFILDCTGCHQFNETRAFKDGAPRSELQWMSDVGRMLRYAGATSGFPVIAADRDSVETAEWLVAHLADGVDDAERTMPEFSSASMRATITEYDLPVPPDLPHDVAVDASGNVLVTGMFTHRIYVVDPGTGAVSDVAIPTPSANPRAIEIDADGDWWVLLGAPRQMARFDVSDSTWESWDIGMYPHSVAVGEDGDAVWFNGHFTKDPELIGRLDVSTGETQQFEAPSHPSLADQGGPVPYEQRIAPDGTVWMSELQGNRIIGFDPATETFTSHALPEPWSGPRRFDVAADGTLWIPAYSGNTLWHFDPQTESFTGHALPASDCLPYIARVSPTTGHVWIGTAAADVVYRFEPVSENWTAFPLATRGATIRHMAIDPRNDDVWLAYGASPAIHPARIARVRLW